MTKKEFYLKWDRDALNSQSACNVLALINHGFDLLKEWREIGGRWNGEDCPHLKFFLNQIGFLTFGHEVEWPEWTEEYNTIMERTKNEN